MALTRLLVMALAAALVATNSAAAAPSRNKLRMNGPATVVSVDGPADLTLRAKGGRFKVRLALIDTPRPGECGAAEATAALTRFAKRRRGAVRYVIFGRRDATGAYAAAVGPRNADLLERSLARDLVEADWARPSEVVTVSEADGAYLRVAGESFAPRPVSGVWATCGGRLHLPAGEPVPTHAAASWAINPDGITESVGPVALPAALTPSTAPTVTRLREIAPIETSYIGDGVCWARMPSFEVVAFAATSKAKPDCATADVYAIVSTGPGVTATTRGLRAGSAATDALQQFPRLSGADADLIDSQLPLAGYAPVPWAWQTLAGVTRTGTVTGFLTSTGRWEG